MAIESKQLLSWADIQAIYTSLNQIREDFSMNTVNVPGKSGTVKNSDIQRIDTYINEMRSNRYIGDVAITGVTIPDRGTLIYPVELRRMSDTLVNIEQVCTFNSSFKANDCNGFNSSFRSSHRSCNVFNSSFRAGFNASFRASFNSDYTFSGCSTMS